MAELKIDIKADANPIRELNKEKLKLTATLARTILEFGKESEQAKKAGQELKNVTVQHKELTKAVKDLSGGTKMSTFQMMEFGENLTVVSAGITAVLSKVIDLGKELYSLGKTGAEFGVLKNAFDELNGGTEKANDNLALFRKALSGNFNEREIISFSNKMTELGYSTEQTAQIFDLSERSSDKFDGSIEKANDALLRFLETGKGKGLYNISIQIGEVEKKMSELSGMTDEQIKKLSSEEQQLLRTTATLELYGNTIEDISAKTLDNADKIRSFETAIDNVKFAFGEAFSSEVISNIETFGKGLSDVGLVMKDTEKTSKDLGSALGEALGKVMPFAFGGWAGVIAQNFGMITGAIKSLLDTLRSWSPSTFDNIKSGVNSFLNVIIAGVKEALSYLSMLGFTPKKEAMGGIPSTAYGGTPTTIETTGTTGKSGRGGRTSEVSTEKEILDAYREQEKVIKKIQEEMLLNAGLTGAMIDLTNKLAEAEEKLLYIKTGVTVEEQRRSRFLQGAARFLQGAVNSQGGIIPNNTNLTPLPTSGETSFIRSKDISVMIEGLIVPVTESFTGIFDSIGGTLKSISVFFGEAGNEFISELIAGFDRIVGIVQMIVGIFESIKAVNSFIGIVSSIFTGGAGMAGLSRTPMPMLLPRVSSTSNVYISANMDGLTFLKSEMPKYKNYQSYRKI